MWRMVIPSGIGASPIRLLTLAFTGRTIAGGGRRSKPALMVVLCTILSHLSGATPGDHADFGFPPRERRCATAQNCSRLTRLVGARRPLFDGARRRWLLR